MRISYIFPLKVPAFDDKAMIFFKFNEGLDVGIDTKYSNSLRGVI